MMSTLSSLFAAAPLFTVVAGIIALGCVAVTVLCAATALHDLYLHRVRSRRFAPPAWEAAIASACTTAGRPSPSDAFRASPLATVAGHRGARARA